MANGGDQLLVPLREAIQRNTWTVLPTDVRLVIAERVGNAGMLGAALSAESYYKHLHPSPPINSLVSAAESSISAPPSPALSNAAWITPNVTLLGGMSMVTAFCLFVAASRGKFSVSSFSTVLNSSLGRNSLLYSHAFLAGAHLIGMFVMSSRPFSNSGRL